jgi:hypothetical protein
MYRYFADAEGRGFARRPDTLNVSAHNQAEAAIANVSAGVGDARVISPFHRPRVPRSAQMHSEL